MPENNNDADARLERVIADLKIEITLDQLERIIDLIGLQYSGSILTKIILNFTRGAVGFHVDITNEDGDHLYIVMVPYGFRYFLVQMILQKTDKTDYYFQSQNFLVVSYIQAQAVFTEMMHLLWQEALQQILQGVKSAVETAPIEPSPQEDGASAVDIVTINPLSREDGILAEERFGWEVGQPAAEEKKTDEEVKKS